MSGSDKAFDIVRAQVSTETENLEMLKKKMQMSNQNRHQKRKYY